jgi:hypothetical protein
MNIEQGMINDEGRRRMIIEKWLMIKIFLGSNLCGAFQT